MKKVVAVLFAFFFVGTNLAVAATAKSAGQIKNTKIVQASQDLELDYLGTPIFVPKGQTVILGERPNGSIVIRGLNIDGAKVGPGTFSTEGYSVVSYQPKGNLIFLNRGKWLTLRDPHGETVTINEKGAVLANNAKINSNTLPELKEAAKEEAASVAADLQGDADADLFVNPDSPENTAAQQAIEDVLSPSAPRE